MGDAGETRRSEEAGSRSASRWLPLLALAALLLFASVAGTLARRQYQDTQRRDLTDARARAFLAAAVFDTYFAGQIATLSSVAQAPAIVSADAAAMRTYLGRVQRENKAVFDAGLSWIDRDGEVRVSTNRAPPGPTANVSDRSYFTSPLTTGKPFVSEGLTGRTTGRQVIVTAVPTRDENGDTTGVLTGTRLIRPSTPDAESIDLGFAGLTIIDRKQQSVLAGFARPRSLAGVRRFGAADSGVLSDATGLDGNPGHVLAYARSEVPQWTVILDQPRSEIFASARHSLKVELALIAGATLIGLALLAWILARARAEARVQREQAHRRRLRYEEEHRVATTLQRSLLSELPEIAAIDSAARYQAGSTGLEVGGDWYDVLELPGGIIHLSVGDIAGRGVAAAALMGQLRNAFRAYAYDHTSPAAIMARLIRHMSGDEMATAVCIAIDPRTRQLTYSSAGHPPALLRDDETGEITRLDLARAPPLGFTTPEAVREMQIALPSQGATLLAYTDGMIERRDRPIDDGIERLEAAFRSADVTLSASVLADRLVHEVAEVTAADDDIALLVIRLLDVPLSSETRDPDAPVIAERT